VCACPATPNASGEHLLSLVRVEWIPRLLERLLDEREFLSPYGIRSVSRVHAERRDLGTLPGIGRAVIEYVPGESNSGLFGGNSNWRGPVWLPTNYVLVQSLEKLHRYLGEDFRVRAPSLAAESLSLREVSRRLSDRLVDLLRRDDRGHIPALPASGPFRDDPHWKDLLLFNEYFHGDTGQGLGAMHQTGWTGLIANLVERRYRDAVPEYWKRQRVPSAPRADPVTAP